MGAGLCLFQLYLLTTSSSFIAQELRRSLLRSISPVPSLLLCFPFAVVVARAPPAPLINPSARFSGRGDCVAFGQPLFLLLWKFPGHGVGFPPDSGLAKGLESSPGLGVGDSRSPLIFRFFVFIGADW